MNDLPVLHIEGLVRHPRALATADLAALPREFQIDDVSRMDPKRRGKAVRLAGLLQQAELLPQADYLTLHASRDNFHASVPLASVRDRGILIYQLENDPLPVSAGGPIRFYIPDFAACHSAEVDECANVKFVDRLELCHEPGQDNRPHDEKQHAALHENESPRGDRE